MPSHTLTSQLNLLLSRTEEGLLRKACCIQHISLHFQNFSLRDFKKLELCCI